MKKIKLLICLIFLLTIQHVKAAENEPNNTKGTANTLALNGNNTGNIGNGTDVDWWKITTNEDGILNVSINVSNGIYLYCYIYDNDGTTQLGSGYSSSSTTVSVDGLAAGSYYIKLQPYYSGQMPAYTVSNTLTKPTQENDAEPNDKVTMANSLPLNKSKTGHIGYYYDNKRDTADWYEVTTNEDGRLRLTMSSANGQYVYVDLYDNDGTTLLEQGYTSGTGAVVNMDGLAAGTYYVKIRCYYTNGFAPYTISDSLFKPAQANDAEPNDSKTKAVLLPINSNKKGHIGYYFDNKRDTSDWYKITTKKDGSLRLTMASANGQYVYVHLYDKDGNTLLDEGYTSGTDVVANADGLAAGTYYAKVRCYYTNGYAPYTLYDSLFTYKNDNDKEPNRSASQAETVLANETTEGHIGFYYNNERDTVDWWKLNYTGIGALSFTVNEENPKDGGYQYLYFEVYKDTTKSPIHSSYAAAASRTIDLSNLVKGYYWIKIYMYYANGYSSYSFNNSFQQTKAGIQIQSYSEPAACTGNSISYKLSKSSAPYTVQLYRYGVEYGDAKVVTKNNIEFDGLPSGSYTATVLGDGATGNAKGISDTITLLPVPANTNTTAIKAKQAKLTWSKVACADNYLIQYRVKGSNKWSEKTTKNNEDNYILKGLTAATDYQWKIAAIQAKNDVQATSAFSSINAFTTNANFLEDNDNDEAENLSIAGSKLNAPSLMIAPNPATSYFSIRFNSHSSEKIIAQLFSATGRVIWSSGVVTAADLINKQVTVSHFESGIYYLKITDGKGTLMGSTKVSIIK